MVVAMLLGMWCWARPRWWHWGRPASAEMTASMFIPTFGVMALLWAGLVTDFGTLMGLEHAVMPVTMLIAMLLRRDEYSHS